MTRMTRSRKMQSRRWTVAQPHEAARGLADTLRTSELVAQILLNRGVIEPSDCLSFLQPSLKTLHEPSLIPGCMQGCARIARAIREQEQIVIYGDYDADGITAVAILWHAIRLLGGKVRYYIPHRVEEGYGLNAEAIAQICQDGAKLIVSVDCGVTAIEPAQVARDKGVDLIVTDHHEWKNDDAGNPILPDCHTIVHPRLPGGPIYPNANLCGAGVAFKVAWGIGQSLSGASKVSDELRGFLIDALAFAGLGTIADVVPLVGENRIIAHFGLGGLKQSKLTGIRALIAQSGLDGQKLDSTHVGFLLAPRLNAAGRMGHAKLAVEMLTDASHERAIEIATELDRANRERQSTERDILAQALAQVEEMQLIERDAAAIVVGDVGWHEGVVGIVASRLVDKYHRPAIVVALNETLGKGSGRSVDGFHLTQALQAVAHTLEGFGGHEMAAGIKVAPASFETFREAFLDYAKQTIDRQLLVPELRLDCDAELKQITHALVTDLKRLGPFGRGNPKPLIRCRNLTLTSAPRRVGKTGDHLQLYMKQNNTLMKGIAFGAGEYFDQLQPGSTIHVAAEPQLNEFQGRVTVELEIKDLQCSEEKS